MEIPLILSNYEGEKTGFFFFLFLTGSGRMGVLRDFQRKKSNPPESIQHSSLLLLRLRISSLPWLESQTS